MIGTELPYLLLLMCGMGLLIFLSAIICALCVRPSRMHPLATSLVSEDTQPRAVTLTND